jgi:hypothetical protein
MDLLVRFLLVHVLVGMGPWQVCPWPAGHGTWRLALGLGLGRPTVENWHKRNAKHTEYYGQELIKGKTCDEHGTKVCGGLTKGATRCR